MKTLSNKQAKESFINIFTISNLSSAKIKTMITLNKVLNKDKYDINDISILVNKAFENKWNTKRNITNYRSLIIKPVSILCTANVKWQTGIIRSNIKIIFDNDMITISVINLETGQIRQGYIT